jgi:hypothetical protein
MRKSRLSPFSAPVGAIAYGTPSLVGVLRDQTQGYWYVFFDLNRNKAWNDGEPWARTVDGFTNLGGWIAHNGEQ